ncbi:MAG: hypothetical protein ACHP9T_08445 [Caulobacterales bacterium]|jgi:hypothetical protein
MTNTITRSGRPTLTGELTEDRQGRPCFRIALSGKDGAGRHALVDAAGLEALQRAGARTLYVIGDASGRPYVCFRPHPIGSPMTAARAIMGDPEGKRIEHLGGDRFDLRSSSLFARAYAGVGDGRLAARRSVQSAFLRPVSRQAAAA